MAQLAMEKPVRLMIVENHPAFRRAVSAFVCSVDGIELVVAAADSKDAVSLGAAAKPDAALVNLDLGDSSDGLAVASKLREELPSCRILLYASKDAVQLRDLVSDQAETVICEDDLFDQLPQHLIPTDRLLEKTRSDEL